MAINPPSNSPPVEISFKKIFNAYTDITFEKPLELFYKGVDKILYLSQTRRMRTGRWAAVTFPLSIALRMTSRTAKAFSLHGKACTLGMLSGFAGGGFGWWLAGKAVFAAIAAPSTPAVVSGIVAGVLTCPALVPMVAASMIVTSIAVAAVAAQVSILGATANIGVGIERGRDFRKGLISDYGETFSDDPAPVPPPAPVDIEAELGLKPKQPAAPVFNSEAATRLEGDLTYRKIKLKVKAPAARR
ncbi:MAG: hypothetical protein ACAH80_11235 [Alphaproteobacteria bacterium]